MKETDFKVGDLIRIIKEPTRWSSTLNHNCPFGGVKYPIEIIIQQLSTSGSFTHMEAGNMGWSLDCLVTEECIEFIKNKEIYPLFIN